MLRSPEKHVQAFGSFIQGHGDNGIDVTPKAFDYDIDHYNRRLRLSNITDYVLVSLLISNQLLSVTVYCICINDHNIFVGYL